MASQALDLDLLVPTALHDPSQAEGIVAVALIDLQRQGRLSMTGIDADHGQTKRSEFVPKPGRGRTSLEADALHASSLCPEELGNRQRCRKHCAFRRDPTVAVDYTDRRLFKRHVQSNIEFHSCSPDRSSPNLAQARLHKITESQSHIDCAYQAPSFAMCVKTLEVVVSVQQENRTCGVGDSFMCSRRRSRINLAPERPAQRFSHSQDPKRSCRGG